MKFLWFIIIFLSFKDVFAQTDSVKASDSASLKTDTLKIKWHQSKYVKESIVPLSLVLGSAVVISIPGLKESLQKPLSWNWNETSKSHYIDLSPGNISRDYLLENEIRYVPAVAAYVLSLCGVKSKHPFIDKSTILVVSYIVSDFVVFNTKKLTRIVRPGHDLHSESDYSFPSQHTAMAFIAASFLDHELGYISPWISVSGYTLASYVGMTRVANNDHWISDVLMGAAVGLIVTNATYWAYDGIMKHFSKYVVISPFINPNGTGIYLCYQF